jgi:hypothetical protein
MKKLLLVSLIFLLGISIVYGLDLSQQSNKLFLTPFYRASMSQNTNYTYSITINPPDKVSNVLSAIVNLQVYITPTVTFNIWANGQPCNTASYTVSTTYASSGQGMITFDCSNILNNAGSYTVTIRPSSANTGASTAWIDITYINNQSDYVGVVGNVETVSTVDNVTNVNKVASVGKIDKGNMDVFGTEYYEGDDATIFLLLKDSDGIQVSNAVCTLDIYYPNIANQTHPEWINNGLMMYKEEGLYYYDFTVPLTSGLYMVNAECTYISEDNYYYTLSYGSGPTRNITTGTYTGDSFVLNDYQEWLYVQCDSGTVGGGAKACDVWNEWNITTAHLGNVTQLFVQFLGENSIAATMTQYWWNWSNSAWVTLPNTITFKSTASGGVPSGIDEYLSNRIPLAAIGTGANFGLVRIRSNTVAGTVFKQYNNWLTLRTSQYTTTIEDLKGSGEVHVNSLPAGTNRFFKVLTCDGFIDGRCGIFTNDEEYDLEEGEIEDFINISATSTKSNMPISFNTPFTMDCTALYWIKEWNGTGWADFTDYTLYSQPAEENCIITLNKNIVSGTEYQFWTKFDNYMKWEVDWTKSMSDTVNKTVHQLCDNRNFTYVVPITDTTPTTEDSITNFCYEFMDDQYWLNNFYDGSLSIDTAGPYASYVQEMRFYRNVLFDRYQFLILGNNTEMMSDYYTNKIWTRTIRNLTDYKQQLIADTVWNNSIRNLTYYPPATVVNETSIANAVWGYTGTIATNILSQFANYLFQVAGGVAQII